MERRRALALSVVATLMVLAMVGMGVSLVRMTLDRDDRATSLPVVTATDGTEATAPATLDGGPAPLDPVVSYLDVYEVVPGSFATSGTEPGPTDSGGRARPAPNPPAGAGTTPPTSTARPTSPSPVTVTPPPPPPITAAPPAPTSTVAPRPPGVPSDWPTDKPVPPMPVGCREPQLEDNGIWNCQH